MCCSARLTTGCLTLDLVLGGGIPRGRVIEIYGPESSGKTTLALCIMAEAQKQGDNVALIDAEYAYDKTYGKKLGLLDESLFYAQPDHGDAALEVRSQSNNVCNGMLASVLRGSQVFIGMLVSVLQGSQVPGLLELSMWQSCANCVSFRSMQVGSMQVGQQPP